MKKISLILFSLLAAYALQAQNTYVINGMACNSDTLDFANPNVHHYTNVADDVTLPKVSIGFPFCYFGTTFDSLAIGSNGCIWIGNHTQSFKTFSIPAFGDVQTLKNLKPNCILANYQDMNPMTLSNPANGISYSSDGFAPNRTFTIEYKKIKQFAYVGDSTFWSKVVLHENTNEIEIHTIAHPNLDSFSVVNSVMGLVPDSGSTYTPVIPTGFWGQWNAHFVAFRFIPVGACALPGAYNSIFGNVYYDENRNCTFDSLDYTLQGELIVTDGGNTYTYTDALGNYTLLVGAGMHSVERIPHPNHNNYCPTAPYYVNFIGTGVTSINNTFADTAANCVDLYSDIGTGLQRLCRVNHVTVTYGNGGTIASTAGTVTVILPTGTVYMGSTPAPAGINGNVLTYNIPGLQPNGTGTILIQDSVICDTALMGNIISFSANFTSNDDECDINNLPNLSLDACPVMNAWDPNDCRVLSQSPLTNGYVTYENIDNNDILTYMIRFQNTGTDTAFSITVEDMLPAYLNAATVLPGASSHPYQFVRYGNKLRFIFSNIMLPDSNVNETASHGFVRFTAQQIAGNTPGTSIHNFADIFFDFNPAVTTNTATVLIPEVVANDEISKNALHVYPNPTSDAVRVELTKANSLLNQIEVIDVMGKKVALYHVHNSQTEISLQHLPKGIYFLQAKDDNEKVYTYKVILK